MPARQRRSAGLSGQAPERGIPTSAPKVQSRTMGPARTRVAVVNTSEEVAGLLRAVLQMEGYATVEAFTLEFKRGIKNFGEWAREHRPEVIIWDVAIPYEENWDLFLRISQSEEAAGIAFVVTTTNKDALEMLVGPTPTCELVGKPFDLDHILDAVKRSARAAK